MTLQYFAVYLRPTRSNFSDAMSKEERNIMQEHVIYWKEKMNKGKVVAFGPVIDPKETYGLGIIVVENEKELLDFIENDPASKINRYEYYPMRAVVPMK
ncbi:MAG: hypothetical protein H6567_05210 [Lewinellaceae bacterium]|nr:hypothetical protein [Lewinellaceae bacterium]